MTSSTQLVPEQEPQRPPRPALNNSITKSVNKSQYYREGRDFYDDQYYSSEFRARPSDTPGVHGCSTDTEEEEASVDDQLDFSPQACSGLRQDELNVLRAAYKRILGLPITNKEQQQCEDPEAKENDEDEETKVQEHNPLSSLCLISGISGTGKSTLFDVFAQELLENNNKKR